jgi:hypothetical protein
MLRALAEAGRTLVATTSSNERAVAAEELAERAVLDERVAQAHIWMHLVEVAPPDAMARQETALDEIGHDAVGGALGNSDLRRDVAQSHAGGAHDANQSESVVRQKRPRRRHQTSIDARGRLPESSDKKPRTVTVRPSLRTPD